MSIILSLDMATVTGYSVIENGIVRESGVWDFNRAKGEHYGHMFLKLIEKLEEKYEDGMCVAYELAHHRAGAPTRIGVGMNGAVLQFCALHNIKDIISVHTAIIKKWATGNGRADKADMKHWASQKVGRQINDDNEADAIAVGFHALSLTRKDPF